MNEKNSLGLDGARKVTIWWAVKSFSHPSPCSRTSSFRLRSLPNTTTTTTTNCSRHTKDIHILVATKVATVRHNKIIQEPAWSEKVKGMFEKENTLSLSLSLSLSLCTFMLENHSSCWGQDGHDTESSG
jgi:hypothetical protein